MVCREVGRSFRTNRCFGRWYWVLRINVFRIGVAPGIFRQGADSSDEGAKIRLSGYCKCQKSPKK